MSSVKILFLFLYKATNKANPTETSAAATVMIKKTNMLPSRFAPALANDHAQKPHSEKKERQNQKMMRSDRAHGFKLPPLR